MSTNLSRWLRKPHPFLYALPVFFAITFAVFRLTIPIEGGKELEHLAGNAMCSAITAAFALCFYACTAHVGFLLRRGMSLQSIKDSNTNFIIDLEEAHLGYADAFRCIRQGILPSLRLLAHVFNPFS